MPGSVSVAPASVTLAALGDTARLVAQVRDQSGSLMAGVAVTWSSSAPGTVTVDATGLVTAVAAGSATITAAAGSVSGSAAVAVHQVPATLTLAPDSLTFEAVGDTATVVATVLDANGHAISGTQVAWASGDTLVATVDATGLVTAVAAGSATITAAAGSVSGSAAVAVHQVPATLTLAPDSLTFEAVGDTATVVATVLDANGHAISGAQVAWTSGDTLVATVDATGLVTAMATGRTEASATAGGLEATVAVVVEFHAVSISLEPPELVFTALGDTATLTATAVDRNGRPGAAGSIRWASGDTTVATVDSSGLVTALGNGAAQISATSGAVSARAAVAVDQAPATLAVVPESLLFEGAGDTATLVAEVTDANGHEIAGTAVAWTSGDPSVAAVDSTGLVTAIRSGATRVTATSDALTASATVEVVEISSDRDVLEFLYHSTGGDGWRDNENWLTNAPLSEWAGVTTYPNGRVQDLWLRDNNLEGPIPRSLGRLDQLFILNLSSNSLRGPIPSEIGQLRLLEDLRLAYSDLAGPLPPEMGDMAGLRALTIRGTNLSGPVPKTFANLNLESFLLSGSFLCIPSGLTAWYDSIEERDSDPRACIPVTADREALVALYNATGGPAWRDNENWLSDAPIDTWRGVTTDEEGHVTELDLSSNNLSGPLPPEIGDMASLEEFSIYGNRLSGSLPPELGNLKALKEMSVADNRLEGFIPPELGDLASLEDLSLGRNSFSGAIPPELGKLSNLERLWLFQNQLTGGIPPELGNLAKLKDMTISTNPLTGRIPPELGRLSALEDLNLGRTSLSGPIPPELGQLSSLKSLGLCVSNLSGPLPPELGDIRTLESLDLCHNPDLSGLLPRALMNLELLSRFLIYGTELCPQIDGEFREWLAEVQGYGRDCEPAEVERLALAELFARTGGDSWSNRDGWNSGAPLGNWHGVTTAGGRVHGLVLPANGLRGPLAPEIANLTELRVLNVGDNQLSGEFPVVVASMAELDTIRVSGNRQMEGRLPFRLTELPGLETLAFANTGLCASPAETFQRWLGGLRVAEGATCGNPEEVTLSIPVVYLTQAIQRPAGDVPLIQGRDALLRVFLESDQSQAFFEPEVVATLSRGGREVHRVVMRRNGDLLATFADESDLRNSYNAVIPSRYIVPGTELVVEADPGGVVPLAPGSQTRFPASGTEPLNVIQVPPMEVTVVPVVEAEQPDSSIYEWTDNIRDNSPQVGLFRYAFPFSEFRVGSRETYVTSVDLTNRSDRWRLILELEAVRAAENGQGYWYAPAASVNGTVRGLARIGGWVSLGKPSNEEFAHELGHNLNLAHAPCGGAAIPDPEFPYANGSIGVWGYDFRDGTVVSPDRRRDIMGYCYEQGWLSDYYFEKVIDYRAGKEGGAAAAVAGAPPRSETLVLWGGVEDGELRIEPPFSMTAAPRLPENAGPYRLEGIGSDGQVELSLSFTPGEDKFGDKYFFFTVPIEADWAESLDQLTLTGPEGTVTVGAADERALSVVTDPATGRIRSILRDWDAVLPATLGLDDSYAVTIFRGLEEAVRLRR